MPRDLLTALCLVLVLEGILPFLNPAGWKRALASLTNMHDRHLRVMGAVCMLAGIVGLQWIR